jgi:hypothetical protein
LHHTAFFREPRGVIRAARSLLSLDVEGQLLPEEVILRGKYAPGTEEVPTKSDDIEQDM